MLCAMLPSGEPSLVRAPLPPEPPPQRLSQDPRVAPLVHAEQVRILYRQSVPVLLANVVNALILSAVLWSHSSHDLLVSWTVAMAGMVLWRIQLRTRYWSRDRIPAEQGLWGARFTRGSMLAGSLWGVLGSVLLPASLEHQMVVLFVLGGMTAGAAATLSCFMPTYFAFVLPLLLPTMARLGWLGDGEHLAMAAMLGMFGTALTLVARNAHRSLTQAFRLRFENAELYTQVSQTQASLVSVNESLQRMNEQLESRVQKRTEQLLASEQHLQEIVTEAPDAIVVFDELGRVVSANPAAERITGTPLAELEGQPFGRSITFVKGDAARALEVFQSVLAGMERSPEELRIQQADGLTMVIEVKLRVVHGVDGQRRVHSVIRDVSERHRLQRLKQEYESRLRESERLEAVGMLAGGVAHDFNNVLSMILSNVDLLETWGSDPHAKALLGEIRHGSLQAATLTRHLLAFSRQQVLDVKPTDLSQVVSTARSLLDRALGERIQLQIELPDEPTVVLVDATQIEQSILNMLVNARHAMPNGGRVALEVKRMDLRDDAGWPGADPGGYVLLRISDSGTGMDEVTRARVFEPFFTTKQLGQGTGLGLASVHGIVKQAGGHIRVNSALGHGSQFEILLPSHTLSVPDAPEARRAWSPGTGTVLVVEDQEQVRRSLKHLLEDAGYQVVAAENAEQALSLAKKRDVRVDLLVTDVIMPGVSGIELSRRMLTLYPGLAVLLVSGYAAGEINMVAELGESVQFLQKPFDAVSLTSAARSVLLRARGAATETRAANDTVAVKRAHALD
jgi:PAS domain S-box-containing protein